jgi:hypothetical protein
MHDDDTILSTFLVYYDTITYNPNHLERPFRFFILPLGGLLIFPSKKFIISSLGPPPLSYAFYRWPDCFLIFQVLHGVPGFVFVLFFSLRLFMFSLLPFLAKLFYGHIRTGCKL